ncbi:hypothetical protein EC844_1374 [Acinetobacter calcoaceticus]|uniref:Lipoprotein n=1 Tax=Acinetobacter calcoaceticus TaxID=471 RepID=A0A4R1X8R5_ACICA|nr:hypothetical protein EC844_1374 [Acinetobacter calcoaceticus]
MTTILRFFLIFIIPFSTLGCKEKKVDYFKYEEIDSEKVCALKPKQINEADSTSMFDSSFKTINGKFNEKISSIIYEQSLENLSIKKNKYIFCISKKTLDEGFLESQIRVEIKKGSYLRQYEFVNYLCLKNGNIKNYVDIDQVKEKCI